MRRVRVLTVIHDVGRGFGGAEVLAQALATRLDPERFTSYVCITHAPPPALRDQVDQTIAELREHGVRVLALERRSARDVAPWLRLHGLLRRERIDVLHAHMFRASLPATVLGRLARVPVVIAHEHTWSFEGRPLRRLLDRHVIGRLSDRFVAVSDLDRERMIRLERIPAEKVLVIENGLPELPSATGLDVRGELGVPQGVPLVGALGRLEPQKAFEVLVDAAALLRRELPDLHVVVCGEGSERRSLERRVRAHGLDRTFLLPGNRRDVRDLLGTLDVATLPSRYEGRPVALMEYMAAARPVVATAVGGVPDVLHDGVDGVLVPPDDPAALASAIRRLLRDPDLAGRLGSQAQRRQRAAFGMDAMVRRVEDLYLEHLDRARGGRRARAA